nr:uncharacterized protein LOC129153175 [Nothobranchius furzeri]
MHFRLIYSLTTQKKKKSGKYNTLNQEVSGENLESLQTYIDKVFEFFVMGPKKSAAETETPGTKRSRPQDLPEASSPRKDVLDLLQSIDKWLLGFEGRLHLLEVLHKEFQDLQTSLEFSQEQVERLVAENTSLRESVSSLTAGFDLISQDNKALKETVLDLQSRSVIDNLVFVGLLEQTGGEAEDCEQTIDNFLHTHMKIPEETVKNITFHRVHRLGARRTDSRRPRPIMAKFEHFKQKDLVKSRGRELKGKDYSVDHFPKEILDHRQVLFPLRKKFIQDGKLAVISVDKLFVDSKIYKERGVTDWLY